MSDRGHISPRGANGTSSREGGHVPTTRLLTLGPFLDAFLDATMLKVSAVKVKSTQISDFVLSRTAPRAVRVVSRPTRVAARTVQSESTDEACCPKDCDACGPDKCACPDATTCKSCGCTSCACPSCECKNSCSKCKDNCCC